MGIGLAYLVLAIVGGLIMMKVKGDSFSANITGTGDADIYVRKGAQADSSNYDCRPYENGSDEACVVEGAGTYYVAINGYTAATYELVISYMEPGEGGGDVPPPVINHLDESGTLAKGEMRTFEIDVVQGKLIVLETTAANDVDLYIRMSSLPTRVQYDQRAYTASGNETIRFMPPSSGKLFIMVDDYAASDFKLVTSDN